MERVDDATDAEHYERPVLRDYGGLVEMTAGCLGPRRDEVGSSTKTFRSASPALGDSYLCD